MYRGNEQQEEAELELDSELEVAVCVNTLARENKWLRVATHDNYQSNDAMSPVCLDCLACAMRLRAINHLECNTGEPSCKPLDLHSKARKPCKPPKPCESDTLAIASGQLAKLVHHTKWPGEFELSCWLQLACVRRASAKV